MTREQWKERWHEHAKRLLLTKKGRQTIINHYVLDDLLNWSWQAGYSECAEVVRVATQKGKYGRLDVESTLDPATGTVINSLRRAPRARTRVRTRKASRISAP